MFIRFPDESSAFISKFQDVAAMDYTTHQLPNHQPMFPVSLEKSISLANPPLKPTFLFFAKKMTVKQKKPFNVQILRFQSKNTKQHLSFSWSKKNKSRSPRFRTHLLMELFSEPDQDRLPLSSLSLSGDEVGLSNHLEADLLPGPREAMARADLKFSKRNPPRTENFRSGDFPRQISDPGI